MQPQESGLPVFLLFLISTVTAKLNLLENPSFEQSGAAWDLWERASLWEVRPATEAIKVSTDNPHKGHSSLLLTPPRDQDLQAVCATQYVPIQNVTTAGPESLKISFQVSSENFKHFRAIVAISYVDGFHMLADLSPLDFTVSSSEDDEDDFTEVCGFIPAYGQVRALMLHFVLDREARSKVYVDSVRVLRNQAKGKSCALYRKSFPQRRQTIPNFLTPTEQQIRTSITVATQLTADRWAQLEAIAERWQGPVSAALLLFQGDRKDKVQELVNLYHQSNVLQKFVSVHLVFEDELNGEDSIRYPANHLRNVALANAGTTHIFCLDADIMPIFSEPTTFKSVARAIESMGADSDGTMWAFIPPLFSSKDPVATSFPEKKDDLLWQLKSAKSFEQMTAASHSAVKYTRWKANHRAYQIPYQENMEPYFIVRSDSPLLNDMFAGYGHDRSAYSKELNKAGYRFAVLPDIYLISVMEPENTDTILSRAHSTVDKFLVDIQVFLNAAFHEKEMEHGYFRYPQNNRAELLAVGDSSAHGTTVHCSSDQSEDCGEAVKHDLHKYVQDSRQVHSASTKASEEARSDAEGG